MNAYLFIHHGLHITKHWMICLIFLLCCSSITYSSPAPRVQFEAGNKEYRFGNYDKSIGIYEQIASSGYRSSTLFYNLGNAYYKAGNYSKAIVNFERALKLSPQDEDIQFNLKLSYLNTVDKIEPIPKLFYEQWWDNFISLFSSDTWSKIGISFCWVTLLFAAIYIFGFTILHKKAGFYGGVICFVISSFLLLSGRVQHQRLFDHKTAVIMEASAYIKSSPEEKSTNLFMLHAGTKIEIVDELQGWKKIRIANGNVGWISDKDVETI